MKEKAQDWPSGGNHDTFGGWAPHGLARWHRDHSSSVYRGYEHISICFDLFMAFVGPAGPCSLVRLPWNPITSICFMDHTGFLPLCAYPVSADTAGGFSNLTIPNLRSYTLPQNRDPEFGDQSLGVPRSSLDIHKGLPPVPWYHLCFLHWLTSSWALEAASSLLHQNVLGEWGREDRAQALSITGSWELGVRGSCNNKSWPVIVDSVPGVALAKPFTQILSSTPRLREAEAAVPIFGS